MQTKEMKAGFIFYDDHRYKCHVVTIIKDKNQTLIVYKYYSYKRHYWFYKVEGLNYAKYFLKSGTWKCKLKNIQ